MLQPGVGIRILNSNRGQGRKERRNSTGQLPQRSRGRVEPAAALALALLCSIAAAQSGSGAGASQDSFRLKLPVDEVVLTFHAEDADGMPVNDLQLGEIRLLDNGAAPRRIVAFDRLADRPIHAGILLDTSDSMRRALPVSKAIAKRFVNAHIKPRDDSFVMDFSYGSEIAQPRTADPALMANGISAAPEGNMKGLGGTALYAAIFRACYYEFGQTEPAAGGNVLLLLSDGEDTAGHASMEEAIAACQRSNTTIYAFRPRSGQGFSTGPRNLAELTAKTGGRVFVTDGSQDEIDAGLKTIESEVRNQYRIVYAPAGLKRDGSFHRIELQLPDRAQRVAVRPGYYAPSQ